VNCQVIFEPNDFIQLVSSLVKTIDMDDPPMSVVELSAKVKGSKNARLSVKVTAVFEETAPPVLDVEWYLDIDYDGIGGIITGMGTENTPPPADSRGMWVRQGGDRE